jgi:hypothetical protein
MRHPPLLLGRPFDAFLLFSTAGITPTKTPLFSQTALHRVMAVPIGSTPDSAACDKWPNWQIA